MDFAPIPDVGTLDAQEFRDGYPETRLDGKRLDNWKRSTALTGMTLYFYGEEGNDNTTGVYREYCRNIGREIGEVIEDVIRGPFYLEALLSGSEGVLRDISQLRMAAGAQIATLEKELADAKQRTERLGKQVSHVSIGQKLAEMLPTSMRAIFSEYEKYKIAALEMYESQRKLVYHEKLEEMLGSIYNWLEGYVNNSLHVFNLASREIYQACKRETTNNAQNPNPNALVSFASVQDSIKQRFNELQEGADESARVESILKRIADSSLNYAEIANTQSGSTLRDSFEIYVEGFINEVFKATNEVNLDNLLGITYSTHSDRVERVKNYWGNEMWNAATPMFAASSNVVVNPVQFSYVSIPENSNCFMQGIEEYTTEHGINATLKRSVITERVFWLNTYNGLPLCYYSLLANQEEAYEDALNNNALRRGLHLVMPNMSGHGLFNWVDIPSPRPHPLLANDKLSSRQESAQQQANELIKRAVEVGAVVFSDDGTTLHIYQLENENGNLMNKEEFDALRSSLPERTEEKPTPTWWKARLTAIDTKFQNDRTRKTTEVVCGGDSERFATALKLQPHEYTHQASETATEHKVVATNRAKLNHAMQRYVLSSMPFALIEIKRQLSLFEELRDLVLECLKGIDDGDDQIKHRQKVLIQAERVAILQLYGIIRTRVGRYTYVHEGEERDFLVLDSSMPLELRKLAADYLLADFLARQEGQDNVDVDLVLEQYLRAKARRDDMEKDEIDGLFAQGDKLKTDRWDKAAKRIKGERETLSREDRDFYSGFYTSLISALETELEAFEMVR